MLTRRRSFALIAISLGLCLAGCGDSGGGSGGGPEGGGGSGTRSSTREGVATSKGGAHADLFKDGALAAGTTARPVVRLKTTEGEMLLELDRRAAPDTVDNFLDYVRAGFYTDTLFHRVLPGVLVHGGGKDARGVDKPRGPAVRFEGENGRSHRRGALAMWRDKDPQSATSEFFFDLADNDGRKPGSKNFDFQSANRGPDAFGYCVFGKVKDAASLAVLERLGAAPVVAHPDFPGETSKPSAPARILSAEIVSE